MPVCAHYIRDIHIKRLFQLAARDSARQKQVCAEHTHTRARRGAFNVLISLWFRAAYGRRTDSQLIDFVQNVQNVHADGKLRGGIASGMRWFGWVGADDFGFKANTRPLKSIPIRARVWRT